MKAAFIAGKGSVELRELPVPAIGENEILVRMRACGICGTDLEKVHGEHITPPVLGHEVAGEIEDIGRSVKRFSKGDRVAVHHHISCKKCFYCKKGLETMCEEYPRNNLDPCGLAEYFRVPDPLISGGTVYRLPDEVDLESGSQVEPTACCIRGLNKAGIKPGESVAVFGVGPVGLTHVQLLKLAGASSIFAIDLIEERRVAAVKLGADFSVNPAQDDPSSFIKRESQLGVDHAIVATGSPQALEQAVASVRKAGKVLLFGAPPKGSLISLDASKIFLNEITFHSSYSTSETEMRTALQLIQSKRINPSITISHRIPLAKTPEAFSLAEKGEALKVIIEN